MKYPFLTFVLLISIFLPHFSAHAKKAKLKKIRPKPKTIQSQEVPKKIEAKTPETIVISPPVPRPILSNYRVNTMMGLNVFRGSAFVSAIQVGTNLSRGSNFYWGPEVDFSLYDSASVLSALAGIWREWRIHEISKLGLSLGLLGGVGFASGLDGVPPTVPVFYFDTSLSQDIDELAVIQAHLRPGMIGRNFAFMMNFSVGFRL